jgi:hypothetical protein
VNVGFVVDRVALEQVFLHMVLLSPVNVTITFIIIIIIIRQPSGLDRPV